MKKSINRKPDGTRLSERGNVLFLILIAVILFAALSYAVTSSSRSGGGGDASSETTLVNSAQITQYPASVRTALVRMIVGGRLVEDLIFDRPSNFTEVQDSNRSRDAVFHPQGGGATSVRAPSNVMEDGELGDWFFTSEYQIENIGTTDLGGSNTANDIIAFLPGISKAVCLSLNEQFGIQTENDSDSDGVPTGPTTLPTDDMDLDNEGIGIAASASTHEIAGDFSAQPFGCFDSSATSNAPDQNVYYHVLIER